MLVLQLEMQQNPQQMEMVEIGFSSLAQNQLPVGEKF